MLLVKREAKRLKNSKTIDQQELYRQFLFEALIKSNFSFVQNFLKLQLSDQVQVDYKKEFRLFYNILNHQIQDQGIVFSDPKHAVLYENHVKQMNDALFNGNDIIHLLD